MSFHRPSGIKLVCVLAALGALVDLIITQRDLGDFEQARWVEEHATEARLEQLFHYLHAGLTLLASYFMLKAHNWARWLYVGWNIVRFVIAFMLPQLPNLQSHLGFLGFRARLIPGLAFFVVAVILLCGPSAKEFFARGQKPWWRE